MGGHSRLEQTEVAGARDCLEAALDAQFAEDSADVPLDLLFATSSSCAVCCARVWRTAGGAPRDAADQSTSRRFDHPTPLLPRGEGHDSPGAVAAAQPVTARHWLCSVKDRRLGMVYEKSQLAIEQLTPEQYRGDTKRRDGALV